MWHGGRFWFLGSLGLLSGLGLAFGQSGVAYYVSPTGSDSSAGSQTAPFGTLEKARDRVRATRTGTNTATIWLVDGTFYRTNAFALTSLDTNLVIAAVPGASPRLCGGVTLDPAWFTVVTSNSPVWPRLDATAKGVVLQADLPAHGRTNFGVLRVRNALFGLNAVNPGPLTTELFLNEQPMSLGRWPNGSVALDVAGASTNSFTYTGTRPNRWLNAPDPWYHGWWHYLWDDDCLPGTGINTNTSAITLAVAPANGFQANNPWLAFNLLEEVDTPGEYYLDRTSGILYLWPTTNFLTSEAMLNQMDVPLLTVSGAKNLTLKGLSLYCARGNLLTTDNGCANVLFNQGRLIGAGLDGAILGGGSNIVLNLSEIAYTGQAGVMVNGGGNQHTLVPCNNAVQNCCIHDFSRLTFNYTPAVSIYAVGFKLLHNEIYSAPGMAVIFWMNNHLIAYNDIHDVCQWSGDMGAVGTGGNWAYQGNRILNNFFHNIYSPLHSMAGEQVNAIYDDATGAGVDVASNVFYNVQACAEISNGGRDNHFYNNIVARSSANPLSTGMLALRATASGLKQINNTDPADVGRNQLANIQTFNYQQPPWSTAYPALAAVPNNWNVLTNDPSRGGCDWRAPGGCIVTNNLYWQLAQPYSVVDSALQYYDAVTNNLTNSNPLFVDEDALDLRLQSNSPAFSLPGFGDVQFLSMGPPWPNLTTQATSMLTPTLAEVRAWVNFRGGTNSLLQFYYGTNDMGATTSGWSNVLSANLPSPGGAGWVAFQVPAGVVGRFRATNQFGAVWSATALVAGAQSAQPYRGIVAYWPLDVVNGTTTPDVINGYDMTLVNLDSHNLVAGRWGKALSFSTASNSMLQRLDNPGELLPVYNLTTNGWSVSLWVNAPNGQWGNMLFAEANTGNNTPVFFLSSSTWNSPYQPADVFIRTPSGTSSGPGSGNGHVVTTIFVFTGTWHHLVYTQTGTTGNFYVDGVLDPSVVTAPSSPPALNVDCIGGVQRTSAGSWLTGLIDDVSLWNYGLSAVEVQKIYTNGTPLSSGMAMNLRLSNAGGKLQLSWSLGTLLEATNLTGPWTTNLANPPYAVSPTNARRFYRLKVR